MNALTEWCQQRYWLQHIAECWICTQLQWQNKHSTQCIPKLTRRQQIGGPVFQVFHLHVEPWTDDRTLQHTTQSISSLHTTAGIRSWPNSHHQHSFIAHFRIRLYDCQLQNVPTKFSSHEHHHTTTQQYAEYAASFIHCRHPHLRTARLVLPLHFTK